VNGGAGRFTPSVVVGTDCVDTTGLFTARLKDAIAVALFASVTVTVYVVAELVTVAAPVMAPVVGEMLSPAGSEGLTP